ncbi:OX-2 membrane glycoprotein-like [Mugil cephalus]|uniref:OX-2 membrane glycoprotein-like n=1 Tax=Mugil cephalus TaxID=48193 RepID=UPI001FB71CE0|nr:OX-2 membrane glycoprotein-like [Mugil cephalus]
MLLLLITVCLLKGVASQIIGGGNATAVYGGNAHYSCSLANPTGVLQVTWQRLFHDESVENIATYSKRFGQRVNEPFREKVNFTEASLSSTSITLNNVKWEDESCYICSFNVYPDGSKRKQTCLTVKGISKVNTSHTDPVELENNYQMVKFNCEATGKPAPTIQWNVTGGPGVTDQQEAPVAKERNSDGTFTSSGSVSLRVPAGWKGQVDCLLNSGMESQRRETVPFQRHGPEDEGQGPSKSGTAVVIISIVFILCVAIGVLFKCKRLRRKRENTSELMTV